MGNINESQTQVYLDGGVLPQYGQNNLLDLTSQFFESGKSDAQVLAILCGMGVPQSWAQNAIQEFLKVRGVRETNSIQKNETKMQFTLTELYERVTIALSKLEEMKTADAGRISYTADNAIKVLEGALAKFPVSLKTADLDAVSEEIENEVSPTLKFAIAKEIHNAVSPFNWIDPIKEMVSYINSFYDGHKLSFQVSEAINQATFKTGKLYETLGKDLTEVLKESMANIKNKFLAVSAKHPWSSECKSILESIAREDKIVHEQKGGKIVKLFSPVLTEGNNHIFHLHGKDYSFDGKQIQETQVHDNRYYSVVEGLKLCKHTNGTLTITGQKQDLTIDLTEGNVSLGEINLTNASVIEIKEALTATNFFGYREAYKINTVCNLMESIDLVAEMDDFLSVNSLVWPSLYLTMIAVEEGVYINRINGGMKMNEMKYYPTAEEAVKVAKEFIGYDVSTYLAERLEAEGNTKIVNEENRKKIQEMISFLEGKRDEITTAVKRVGETPELKEALDLVNSEITAQEKELQETFISEKKSKSQYLNAGYVEGTITKS